jgi:hypothetical protein
MTTSSLTGSPINELAQVATAAIIGSSRAKSAGAEATPTRLLARAAIAGCRARAGLAPQLVSQMVTRSGPQAAGGPLGFAPAESRSSAKAVQRTLLRRIVTVRDTSLLEEWCEHANNVGVIVPVEMSAEIISWWAGLPSRPASIFEALGQRGLWLASLNSEWNKPVVRHEIPVDLAERWELGTGALLGTVRRTDPARALTMVQSTWKTDGADERRRFVLAMANGLSMNDEPFLESALDDRSKVVREAVCSLLTKLPNSAFATRMLERAIGCLGISIKDTDTPRKASKSLKLDVEPPKDFDPSMERDGIAEKVGDKRLKANWLRQIMMCVPLTRFAAALNAEPAAIVAAGAACENASDVVPSWIVAAGSAADERWSLALLDFATGTDGKAHRHSVASLWSGLDAAARDRLRIVLMGRLAFKVVLPLVVSDADGVVTADDRWLPEFSASFCAAMEKSPPTANDYQEYYLIPRVMRLIHPSCAERLEGLIQVRHPEPSDGIRKAIDNLRVRAEMFKEFTQS